MSIQVLMSSARLAKRQLGSMSTVLMTLRETALNWLTVASTVAASWDRDLSLRDQMPPRHWWGTSFCSNLCHTQNNQLLCVFNKNMAIEREKHHRARFQVPSPMLSTCHLLSLWNDFFQSVIFVGKINYWKITSWLIIMAAVKRGL